MQNLLILWILSLHSNLLLMMRRGFYPLYFAIVFVSGISAQNGVLYGTVTDGGLQEPLAFANVYIAEMNLGATTDLDGVYRITGIPEGTYQVTFSYLGYESISQQIVMQEGARLELDVTLSGSGVLMDEVVVRGQATGQRAAINQQINSNTIVNVISKEKLQELPDQNAAEAVGRLAGVSVYRDAGEGQRISVRGISPRFNAITINGERLPSTEESERSVDLSMISPDMLAGVELFKAITPDMDGDAIGGTVNFVVATADEGGRVQGRVLSGYNDLRQDYGQFRANVSGSDRFFDNAFGVIATANYQIANRGNESLTTDYIYEGEDQNGNPLLSIENHNLSDKLETRYRYGGSLTLDFLFHQNHQLILNSSLGKTDREELRFRRRFRLGNNYQELDATQRDRQITLLANNLSGEHIFGKFGLEWRASYSSSNQRTPEELRGRFREISAISSSIPNESDIAALPQYFKNDLESMILYDSRVNHTEVNEDRYTGRLDFHYDFKASSQINGQIRAGAKYRSIDRSRDREGTILAPYLSGQNPATNDPNLFLTAANGQILLANFIGDYTNPDFYDGDYDILPGTPEIRNNFYTTVEGVDLSRFNDFFGTTYSQGDKIFYPGHIDINNIRTFQRAYNNRYRADIFINSGDYNGGESVLGSYLRTELNLGKKLTFIGGARWEQTDQEYTSFIITGSLDNDDNNDPSAGTISSKTAGRNYSELLPMFHLKFKATSWLDLRAAVTKSLARPNFFNIVPWEYYNAAERQAQFGDPNLLHTTAWNYDLFLSVYSKFGLFTMGGFYKELENIDFISSTVDTDQESIYQGWSIISPRNLANVSSVKGIELDFQTNLSSLDNFLRGTIFSANLTLSRSKTFYPLFNVETVFVGPPTFFETTVVDTVREGTIVGQADVLANVILGYETGGFSGRISVIYQGDALSPGNPGIGSSEAGVGTIPEQDYFDEASLRFDLAMKQRIDKQGRWTVMFNLNNFTNTAERAFLGIAQRLREEEFYGMTADVGIAFKFR